MKHLLIISGQNRIMIEMSGLRMNIICCHCQGKSISVNYLAFFNLVYLISSTDELECEIFKTISSVLTLESNLCE